MGTNSINKTNSRKHRLVKSVLLIALSMSILSINAQTHLRDTLVCPFKMGYYDVDNDCYKDTTYNVIKIFEKGKPIAAIIDLIPDGSAYNPAAINLSFKNNPQKSTLQWAQSLENIQTKYIEWSETAKENGVTDYEKVLVGYSSHVLSSYCQYYDTQRKALYLSKDPVAFKVIFKVNEFGECSLEISKKAKLIGTIAYPYMIICDSGDRKAKLRYQHPYDYITELGYMKFHTPQQLQSLIDALRTYK